MKVDKIYNIAINSVLKNISFVDYIKNKMNEEREERNKVALNKFLKSKRFGKNKRR